MKTFAELQYDPEIGEAAIKWADDWPENYDGLLQADVLQDCLHQLEHAYRQALLQFKKDMLKV